MNKIRTGIKANQSLTPSSEVQGSQHCEGGGGVVWSGTLEIIVNFHSVNSHLLQSVNGDWREGMGAGFRSLSHPEPRYLAGAWAVILARLRFHLKYIFV